MKAPLKRTLILQADAVATNVDASQVVGECPVDGTITAVRYIPVSGITGQNTNTRRVAITNRGSAGAGTAEPAALQFNSGVNATAFDAKALTLSATAADLDVVAGDVLSWDSTSPGTGLADPGGCVIIEITRSTS